MPRFRRRTMYKAGWRVVSKMTQMCFDVVVYSGQQLSAGISGEFRDSWAYVRHLGFRQRRHSGIHWLENQVRQHVVANYRDTAQAAGRGTYASFSAAVCRNSNFYTYVLQLCICDLLRFDATLQNGRMKHRSKVSQNWIQSQGFSVTCFEIYTYIHTYIHLFCSKMTREIKAINKQVRSKTHKAQRALTAANIRLFNICD